MTVGFFFVGPLFENALILHQVVDKDIVPALCTKRAVIVVQRGAVIKRFIELQRKADKRPLMKPSNKSPPATAWAAWSA